MENTNRSTRKNSNTNLIIYRKHIAELCANANINAIRFYQYEYNKYKCIPTWCSLFVASHPFSFLYTNVCILQKASLYIPIYLIIFIFPVFCRWSAGIKCGSPVCPHTAWCSQDKVPEGARWGRLHRLGKGDHSSSIRQGSRQKVVPSVIWSVSGT